VGNNFDDAQLDMQTWQDDFWVVGKSGWWFQIYISLCPPQKIGGRLLPILRVA